MDKDALRRGLVLGKFMPPHTGHLHLIETAAAQVDELTVLVCSLTREPVPGSLRYEWVRELCPTVRVVHVTDENPQEPHEHPDFWSIWTRTVKGAMPVLPDVVFTSEDYGDKLAECLGAKHVQVDLRRSHVPVSGTVVRQHPHRYWDFIPPCVRPYFLLRVCVYGPESTGKTTLARDLAEHYRTAWVPEFARGYLDVHGWPCKASDIPAIAAGQAASEDALAREARGVLFCDTDLITTRVWSEEYFGACPTAVCEAAEARRYDLYLLTCVDVPWVADVQRDQPHRREYFEARFASELTTRGRPFVRIQGSWSERFSTACAAVDALLEPGSSRPSDRGRQQT